MQSYIRVKGARQIGPLIQYTQTGVNETGELNMLNIGVMTES